MIPAMLKCVSHVLRTISHFKQNDSSSENLALIASINAVKNYRVWVHPLKIFVRENMYEWFPPLAKRRKFIRYAVTFPFLPDRPAS
jgi:hypothetical protein